MRGVLRIELVALAVSVPIVLIRRRDLQNFNLDLLDEAKETGFIAAGRLDADALDLTERPHPVKAALA